MGWFDGRSTKAAHKPKTKFAPRFISTFLQRIGIVNSYDDDVRTYIERGYQQNPVVYGIVQDVAKNFGRAKWCVKNAKGEKVRIPLLDELMRQPNPIQSWTDLMQDYITHKMLAGNGLITGEYGNGINKDKYFQLYVLPSEDIQIIGRSDFRGIRGYKVDFAWSGDTVIPKEDVLHLRNPNPDFDETDNWLYGQSAFRAASRSIMAYNKSLDAGVHFLENKGSQKIVFDKSEQHNYSPEGEDTQMNKLRVQGKGPKNTANLLFMEGYDLGVIDVSSDPKKALVLEQRTQAATEICNVTGYPTQFLGIKDATYQNAKEAKKLLWEKIILPELDELKDGLNGWLAPQYGDIYFDYEVGHIDALQEDKLMRGKAIKEFSGMITINQAREMAGLKPYDWMKEPTNMEEFNEQVYAGFTQSVVGESASDSGSNGESDMQEDNNEQDE